MSHDHHVMKYYVIIKVYDNIAFIAFSDAANLSRLPLHEKKCVILIQVHL